MLERVREYNLLLIPQRGSLFPMKKNKIYTFLAVCTAAILTLSVPAWASQVTITPLDKGTSISQSQVQETQPTKASAPRIHLVKIHHPRRVMFLLLRNPLLHPRVQFC